MGLEPRASRNQWNIDDDDDVADDNDDNDDDDDNHMWMRRKLFPQVANLIIRIFHSSRFILGLFWLKAFRIL